MGTYLLLILVGICVVVSVFSQNCDFDGNGTTTTVLCGWEHRIGTRNGYGWQLHVGPTPQYRTGPQADYSGDGGYLYAPGGRENEDGTFTSWPKSSRTILNSPVIRTQYVNKLMRFHFMMYGRGVGTLNVFVVVKGQSRPSKPQWRRTREKGDMWALGEVSIPSNSTARIIFEAIPTKQTPGDIAIDEINFDDMAINCHFDGETPDPTCQFDRHADNDFDWTTNSGKTPTKKTGPPVDHTRGTSKGVYKYIEATNAEEGAVANLVSTRFQKEVGECELKFFYHMQGTDIGELHVHLITEEGVLGNVLWSRSGQQGTTWTDGSVNLTNVTGPYSFAFQGVRGPGMNGDIAIDDIKLIGIACVTKDVIPALAAGDTYWDYCDSSPCANNGTCLTKAGGYECACSEAWTGANCSIEVPPGPCRSRPCYNGGTCIQRDNNGSLTYNCECPPRYKGGICEIDRRAPYCDSNPCQNGATCDLTVDGYRCLCTDAWNGTHCENDIDECAVNICQNDGNCTNTEGGFNCTCPSEWHGTTCENECEDNNKHCPFWAGLGECTVNPKYMLIHCMESCRVCGDYECQDNEPSCPVWAEMGECGKNPYYMLAECHVSCGVCIDDECRSNPCWNGGTCTDGEDSFSCVCAEGFTGVNCENNTDECASSPCLNNATCVDGMNNYTCNCTDMYEGYHCEHRKDHCSSGPCLNGGNCTNDEDGYACTCHMGYEGDECETDIDECASSPCNNDGFCMNQINSFLCNCTEAWAGVTCDVDFDECRSNPCLHGGVCYHGIGESLFFCHCMAGWDGDICAEEVDECASSPCVNAGTCTDQFNSYTCACTEGWTGLNCDADIMECASDPCLNGATCTDLVGGFSCLCIEGFEGDTCQYDIDECQSDPCLNGGTCINGQNSHLCACPPNYSGRFCEEEQVQPHRSDFWSYEGSLIVESWESHGSYESSALEHSTSKPSTTPAIETPILAGTDSAATTKRETDRAATTERATTTTVRSTTTRATTTTLVTTITRPTTTTLPTTTVYHHRRHTTSTTAPRSPSTRPNPAMTTARTTTRTTKAINKGKTTSGGNNVIPSKESSVDVTNNQIKPLPGASTDSQPGEFPLMAVGIAAVALVVVVIVIFAVVAYRRHQQGRTRVYEQFDMGDKAGQTLGGEMADVEVDYVEPSKSNSFNYSPI